MIKKLLDTYKEKAILAGCLILSVTVCLWLTQKPATPEMTEPNEELGVSIPAGFLVVPLELSNGGALAAMIKKTGVIDVFNNSSLKLAENLRVLKLSSDESPSFGALVPDKQADSLQSLFSTKNLRGALKKTSSLPTRFFNHQLKSRSIEFIQTQE